MHGEIERVMLYARSESSPVCAEMIAAVQTSTLQAGIYAVRTLGA